MLLSIIKYDILENLLKFVCFASSALPRVNKLFLLMKNSKKALYNLQKSSDN